MNFSIHNGFRVAFLTSVTLINRAGTLFRTHRFSFTLFKFAFWFKLLADCFCEVLSLLRKLLNLLMKLVLLLIGSSCLGVPKDVPCCSSAFKFSIFLIRSARVPGATPSIQYGSEKLSFNKNSKLSFASIYDQNINVRCYPLASLASRFLASITSTFSTRMGGLLSLTSAKSLSWSSADILNASWAYRYKSFM